MTFQKPRELFSQWRVRCTLQWLKECDTWLNIRILNNVWLHFQERNKSRSSDLLLRYNDGACCRKYVGPWAGTFSASWSRRRLRITDYSISRNMMRKVRVKVALGWSQWIEEGLAPWESSPLAYKKSAVEAGDTVTNYFSPTVSLTCILLIMKSIY